MKPSLAAALLLVLPVSAQIPNTLTHSVPAPVVPSQTAVQFGFSVAMDNNYTVVGSPSDDLGGPDSGVVKVYNAAGALLHTWLNPRRPASDNFGSSVAIAFPFVVVGAPDDDTGAVDAGRVYVYDLYVPNDPPRVLVSPTPQAGAEFGDTVAIWTDGSEFVFRIAVGASKYDVGAVLNVGQAHVFAVDFNTASVFSHVATLNKPVPAAGDRFGSSVAINGTRVVAGAFLDDTGALNAGSAYVYDVSSGAPGSPVTLSAANLTLNNPAPAADDYFGYSVAMSGDRVVIGAMADGNNFQGYAYVYSLAGVASATLTHTLENPTPVYDDRFGFSVSISGTRVVVGAEGDDIGATTSAGSVYVYDVLNPTPTLVTVSNPSPAISDHFGSAVAISGTRMAVGASEDDETAIDSGSVRVYTLGASSATVAPPVLTTAPDQIVAHGSSVAVSGTLMVVGAPLTNYLGGSQVGRAYVYDLSSATPTVPVATLVNPSPEGGELFGQSVAISGTRVVVGVPYDYNTSITKYSGRAYVYDLGTITPEENPVVILNNPSSGNLEAFGWSVAISGTRVVVGASDYKAGTLANSGRAYVFDVSADYLSPALTFLLNNPNTNSWAAGDYFGTSVAISGTRVAVGAPYFDVGTSGGTAQAGKVYLYDVSGTPTQANLIPSGSVTKLPGAVAADYFGTSVAISGTRLVVGTPNADFGATNAGRAHAYDVTTLASPVLIAHLDHPASGAIAGDNLGFSVAIDGTRAVVAAAYDDAGASDSGTAFVYDLSGTPANPLVPSAALNNPAPAVSDHFGWGAAISGTTVVIGTPDNDDANGTNNGAAYVFGLNVPDIVVEQPVGTNLTSGLASIAFGSVAPGSSSVAKTFTITNTGTVDLTGVGVSVPVGNASDFPVTTTGMPTTVPAGGSTTFSVSFTPTSTGPLAATLSIASSDTDENPFTIALTGIGDATPPDTTIDSGPPTPTSFRSATVAFSGTDNVAVAGFQASLDGAAYATVTSPVSLTGLADGSHTFSVRALDAAGNVDPTPASVTWTVDGTAPVLTLPANIVAEATSSAGRVVTYSANASDPGSGVATSSFLPASASTFPIGTTPVNASATDNAGNTATGSFTVTVVDTTPPVISGTPANITTEATGPAGKVVTFTDPTATDAVDGARTVTCTPPSGSTFAIGTTTVTCTSSDTRSNTASASFTVTVQDTTAPVGGTMMMSPSSPVNAGATLTVSFASWTDAASTPLSYSVLIDNVVVSAQGSSASRNVPAPATMGAHTLKGRIYDSLNNFTEVTQNFTVNSAQQAWRKLHFGSTLNSGNGADNADPDFDGIRNLLEFALGTNPTMPNNGSQLPQPVPSGGNLTLSITQPPGVSGITYGAQISTLMLSNNWTSTGVTDTDPSPTGYTFSAAFGPNPQLFMRIVITNTVD